MNFVVSLCHFCDIHGPSILFTTFASKEELQTKSDEISCQACSMRERYTSDDVLSGSRYLSCRLPTHSPGLVSWLTHACVRSLSCELNPCLFSESLNCAMSVSFSVRDAEARGFYHWLSIVVSSRDLTQLAASWPFLLRNIQTIISWLQDKAVQVYNEERPFRKGNVSQSRPLTQLVRYKAVYARLHCWFAWMIQACGSRLSEKIPRSPHFRIQAQHLFDEGNLKSLRVFLRPEVFDLTALYVLEGRQVIVRGDIPALVQATVKTLQSLLPGDWARAVPDSDEYLEPRFCGLLGVSTQVAVPRPCSEIVRVDMVQGQVFIKTTASLPAKCPTLVAKMTKALNCELLRDKALAYQLQAFHQEWSNIAKLSVATRGRNSTALLTALGVKPQDHYLLSFWSSNVSSPR